MARKVQVVLACVFLVVALYSAQSLAQEEEGSKSKSSSRNDADAATGTTEHPTLSPPPPPPDPLIHNLQFSLPIVTVCILLFIMMIVVIVIMRKARYGQFCCFKPKMRFRYEDDDEEKGAGESDQTPPPTYKMTEMIAPPDYNDALQDVLVTQQANITPEGDQDKEKEFTEVPLEENEVEDDRAPLNP